MLAFHFSDDTLRFTNEPNPRGAQHEVVDDLVMCEKGLHASLKLRDAIKYASHRNLDLVEIPDDSLTGSDKCCAKSRKVVSRISAYDFYAHTAQWDAFRAQKFAGVEVTTPCENQDIPHDLDPEMGARVIAARLGLAIPADMLPEGVPATPTPEDAAYAAAW